MGKKTTIFVIGLASLTLFLPAVALAQQGGGYEITSWSLAGGGGSSKGGSYALVGTIGQHDAGVAMMGVDYELVGGLWGGATTRILPYDIYLPLALRET